MQTSPCFVGDYVCVLNIRIMKRILLLLLTVAAVGCNTYYRDPQDPDSQSVNIRIDSDITWSSDEVKIYSLWDDATLSDEVTKVQVGEFGSIQVFFVGGPDGSVYLMAREVINKGETLTIDLETTAVALITMHPLFATLSVEDHVAFQEMVRNAEGFAELVNEVGLSVEAGISLYDNTNESLLIAVSNVFESLCGTPDDDLEYNGELDDVESELQNAECPQTKSVFQHPQINPTYISAQLNANVLSLRTVWMTPSYYGTITSPSGATISSQIEARDDFGGMDLIFNRTTYGPPMIFPFSESGNYRFNYTRMNSQAAFDFYKRLVSSVLSIIGFESDIDEFEDWADMIVETVMALDMDENGRLHLTLDEVSALDVLGTVVESTIEEIKSGRTPLSQKAVDICERISKGMGFYNKIKGTGNLLLRLGFAFDAPETINFCSCYRDGEVGTCTVATLTKIDGDQQTGYANQRLLLPLEVYVETLDEDTGSYMPSGYTKVKFEVISGGGSVESEEIATDVNNMASTYWRLGDGENQEVKVTAIDVITGREISEPVYFTATLSHAQITIRLDWNKHSSNTDIDLHVVDPSGEKIYYSHMSSASGGYLDRDDVIGPGPEHVRWSDAPAGLYKIYVHYFPNGAEDRSVTSYTVSVTAGDVTYRPKSGSIAYDQYVPVGQFRIGAEEQTMPVTRSSVNLETTTAVAKPDLPEKTK